jgi:transcriptional regulator with XRE-family HTH domain
LGFVDYAKLSFSLRNTQICLISCGIRFALNAIAFENWRMEIGQVIRALRQERDETLEQMAYGIGTDPSNLSRIERGVQQPTAPMLKTIAAALGTTVSALHARAEGVKKSSQKERDLLGGDPSDYSSEAIQLRHGFRTLSLENKRLAVEFVKLLNRTQSQSNHAA